MSIRRALIAGGLAAVLVAGCGSTSTSPTSADPGQSQAGETTPGASGSPASEPRAVTVAVPEQPPTLDPSDNGVAVWRIARNINEALVDLDPTTGEPVPVLAESWEQVDEITWHFKLRPGVTFTNGAPMNAEAVAFSLNRLFGPGDILLAANDLPKMTASVVDGLTVAVELAAPDPILPTRMFSVAVLDPGEIGDSRSFRQPSGTGPYEVENWAPDKLTLVANDGYWGEAPVVDTLEFVWRPESSVRAAMLKNGEAGIVTDLAPVDTTGVNLETIPSLENVLYRFDGTCPMFADIAVRKAIGQVLDRETLAATVFGGLATPASQMFSPEVVGYSTKLSPPAFDPAAAKSVIDAARQTAGWQELPIQIITRSGHFAGAEETSDVFAQSLSDLGFAVEQQNLDVQGWVDAFLLKPAPADRCALIQSSAGNAGRDASRSLGVYYLSDGALSSVVDPDLDSLAATAFAASGDERAGLLAGVIEYAAEHVVPDMPVVSLEAAYGVSEDLDWTPRPDGFVLGSTIK